MTKDWCTAEKSGIRIAVQVTPNSKRTEVTGILDGMLKMRLQAQPIEGKANEALVRYLAEMLGVSKGAVVVTHGLSSKRKLVEIGGVTVEKAKQALVPTAVQTDAGQKAGKG